MTSRLAKLLERGLDHWALQPRVRLRAGGPGRVPRLFVPRGGRAQPLGGVTLASPVRAPGTSTGGEQKCGPGVRVLSRPSVCLLVGFKILDLTAPCTGVGS